MASHLDDPVLPWRIPTPVIVLLCIVIVLLTLAALGIVGTLVLQATMSNAMPSLDLRWPDTPMHQVVWVQSILTFIAMFLVWLFSILVVGAHFTGSHRNAATNAVAMVRVSIGIILVQSVAGATIPAVLSGSWTAGLTVLASGAPLSLSLVALLLAADAYFGAIRQNAAL